MDPSFPVFQGQAGGAGGLGGWCVGDKARNTVSATLGSAGGTTCLFLPLTDT